MPDVELKPQVYKDPRPKEYFDRFHSLVRSGPPESKVYEPVRVVTELNALLVYRARGIGSENVPNGPVILAPNHASFMDHFFTGAFIRRRVQFMGKSQLFKGFPGWVFSHGGVFPVRRGYQDEEAFITADRILARGGAVVMYCEGGRSRSGKIADEARPGIGRIALDRGRRSSRWRSSGPTRCATGRSLRFPKVTVQYGDPFRFEAIHGSTREQQQEVADYILDRIREMHSELARLGRRVARRARRAAARSRAARAI